MHVFDGKNWISIFWFPYFPVLPFLAMPIAGTAGIKPSSLPSLSFHVNWCNNSFFLGSGCRTVFTVHCLFSTQSIQQKALVATTCGPDTRLEDQSDVGNNQHGSQCSSQSSLWWAKTTFTGIPRKTFSLFSKKTPIMYKFWSKLFFPIGN